MSISTQKFYGIKPENHLAICIKIFHFHMSTVNFLSMLRDWMRRKESSTSCMPVFYFPFNVDENVNAIKHTCLSNNSNKINELFLEHNVSIN